MYTQFRKPWVLVAIAFVLIMTVAVRVSEYRMPLWAAQLREEAVAACEALEPPQPETVATDKAADLYRQAWETMIVRLREEFAGQERRSFDSIPRLVIEEYRSERKGMDLPGVIRLPLPSQHTPDDLRLRIREIVEEYRPVLQVLYKAAARTQSEHIVVIPDDETYRSREDVALLHASLGNLPRLLLLASVSALLEGDEAEAITALASFKACCNTQFITPWGPYWSSMFYARADDIWRIMAFGIERNTFSRPTLDILDDLLNYKATITRDDLMARMAVLLRYPSYRVRQHLEYKTVRQREERNSRLFPQLGDGITWYRDRFIMLHGISGLALSRYAQEQLLSGEVLRLPEGKRRRYFLHWRYRYEPVVDDLYGRVEPMDIDYLSNTYTLIVFNTQGEERLGIFRIALAAERCRRDKGEFPENVTDMAPEYITPDMVAKFHEQKYVYKRRESGWAISAPRYKPSDVYSIVLAHPLGDIRWRSYY